MATPAEIEEENRKVRRLQIVVSLVMNTIRQSDMPIEEASELARSARDYALRLFPAKAHVYDLIYQPRMQRLLAEKYRIV